jgi:hypothetical protein
LDPSCLAGRTQGFLVGASLGSSGTSPVAVVGVAVVGIVEDNY